MQIKFGLISADSHALLDRDAYTDRMSKAKWGDLIPHLVEMEDKRAGGLVDRWLVHAQIQDPRGFNCPAAMDDNPLRNLFPQRWDEVPRRAYDPLERLEALDADGVDAEALFPDKTFFQFGDAAFEIDADRAANDALADWRTQSERYIPLAQIPLLGEIADAVAETERCAAMGHRGINMLAEPSAVVPGLKHLADPYWDPLWDACQELEMPIHIHASGGLAFGHSVPAWSGFAPHQNHASFITTAQIWPTQLLPLLVFGGILDRFPRLNWVLAEAGVGPVYAALDACDHEWERRRLWTEGLTQRPSDVIRRQVYVNFWFEVAAIQQRERIGADRIMWESDYPHIVSTYPESQKYAEASMADVPADEARKMLYENALQLYRL